MHDTIQNQHFRILFIQVLTIDKTETITLTKAKVLNKVPPHPAGNRTFIKEGYIVLDDFLRPAECEELQASGIELAKNQPEGQYSVLSTCHPFKQHERGSYFLESGRKISYFYEPDAVESNGTLKVEPNKALHKVGHALHSLHPIFRCYTYSDRVKMACQQLGLIDPAVVQSVYSYKNPTIGSEVPAHQDSTYIWAEPTPVICFWIALEDATTQNGCLWVARGSHKSGVHMRLIQNPDKESKEAFVYDRPFPMYPQSSFTSVPVKKGTCILLHGNVVYKAGPNKSDRSLNSYEFQILEKHNNRYSEDNWLTEDVTQPFPPVYTTPQII